MKNNKSHMLRLKNIGMLVLVPLAVLIVMECVSFLVSGKHVISSRVEHYNLAKTTVQLALTALALSLNMSTGRMDFSLGAQQMIGCIVGGNLALRLGWGPAGVIVLSVAFGALSGLLFILTRIPSMVLGIGMALIYECICFAFSVDGLQLYGRTGMSILNDVWFQLLILAIVLTFYIIINARTKFGYHYKAIRGSQRIALSMGVNVNLNCLVCYTLAGGTIALAGVFSTAYNGVLASTMGMGQHLPGLYGPASGVRFLLPGKIHQLCRRPDRRRTVCAAYQRRSGANRGAGSGGYGHQLYLPDGIPACQQLHNHFCTQKSREKESRACGSGRGGERGLKTPRKPCAALEESYAISARN